MYNTTDSYKSKIYNVNHFLKVYINDAEIESKYILDCKPSSTLFTNGEIELGSTPSQTVELKLYKSVVPATINKVEIKSGITGEIVPIGIYNVDKAPTSDDYTVTLSLADNMIKFEFNYDGSKLVNDNNGKVKIIQVLQDICSKANVELGSTSFLNMNKVIAVYDNTVSARTYLSYIAEQAGGFAFIGRDGKLYIKSFKYALGQKIGEGKSIVIEKTNNLKAKTVIKGLHSPKTTQGINLLEIAIPTQTYRGVTLTNNGDGSFTLNGTATADLDFRVEQNAPLGSNNFNAYKGTYTFYCGNLKSGMWFGSATYDDGAYNFFMGRLQGYVSLLTREVDVGSGFFYIHITSGTTVSNLTLKPMFVKGSYTLETIPNFEPYTGGKPSPNPDYPQKVETVGDNVNLLDVNNLTQALLNINDGTLILQSAWRCTDYLDVFYKEYTFSWESDSTFFQVKVCFYDKNKKFLSSLDYGISNIYSKSFEVPSGTRFMKLAYSVNVNGANVTREKIKLEHGNSRTSYSNYGLGGIEITKQNKNFIKLYNSKSITWGGLTFTLDKDAGEILINGTSITNAWVECGYAFKGGTDPQTKALKKLKANENYVLSCRKKSGTVDKTVSFLVQITEDGKIIATSVGNSAVRSDCTGIYRFWVYVPSGATCTNLVIQPQLEQELEQGSIATDFVENEEENYILPTQQELLEGDYIDNVEHHTWEKAILKGDEGWASTTNAKGLLYFCTSHFNSAPSASPVISNMFQNKPLWLLTESEDIVKFADGSSTFLCMLSDTSIDTVAKFTAWLKSKYDAGTPIIIYYKLENPIELELTDEQKKVISEIHNMDLYEDYTIIESDAEMQVNFARAEIPFRYFQNFEWGAKYKLSKIRYEDGIRVFEKGDDTENTLYINPDNMFIVDQDQIDNIYDELKDLELYSFKGDSIVDPALDIGDIVVIDGKQVLYCGSSQYSGRWKASISSEIKSKERQETTAVKKPSQKTINRRVQSSIDQVNGKIEQLIEENTETSKTLTKHEQTLEGFTDTVSKVEQDIENVKSTANSSVKKVEVKYALGDSSTEAPAAGWSTTAPTWTEGKYMWQKTVTTFVDGSVSEASPTCIQGAKGADGVDGKDGKDGVNGEKGDKGDKGDVGPQGPQGEQGEQGNQGPQGEQGEQGKTGATGKGIKSVQDQYYLSTSNTKQIDGAWKKTQDEWEEGKYIWTRSFITWTDNTTSYTTPCLADSINKANQVASDTAKNLENNYSTTKETKTMIEQEADSIRLEVDTIEKFTRDISSYSELHLVDTADYAENLVLTLKIYGDTEKWKELVPSTLLAPGLTVAPLGTTIDLIVDSQSRLNPSSTKQVFTIKYGKKLRSLGNVRDELDIINNQVTIIRRIGLNDSGQEYVLQTEQTEELGEIKLPTLKDNTYIYVREYPNLEYFCRYITDNDYIKKFATQEELKEATVDLNTKIEQSNKEIILLARQKVGKDEVIASINLTPEEVKILANKLKLEGYTTINGGFKVDNKGNMEAVDGTFTGGDFYLYSEKDYPSLTVFKEKMNHKRPYASISSEDIIVSAGNSNATTIGIGVTEGDDDAQLFVLGDGGGTWIHHNKINCMGEVWADAYKYNSKVELKENIHEFKRSAVDIIKSTDIYEFNYKNNKNNKCIGVIIGEGYKASREIISDNKGVDSYSMNSVSWKAIQEIDEKIEKILNILKNIPVLGKIFAKRWKK